MAGFLLDTNHLSEALQPVSRVRDRIGQLRLTGTRVVTCIPVLCELEAALPSGDRGRAYRRALQRLLGRVRLLAAGTRDCPSLWRDIQGIAETWPRAISS